MISNQRFVIIISFFIALLLTGCVPKPDFLAKNYRKPTKIAVLPSKNMTPDVKAGQVLRNLTYVTLYNNKYSNLVDVNVVDSLLRLNGITDGGQLDSITREDLFEILECDGLMYVDLLQAKYNTVGIKETKVIEARYTLYGRNGKLYEKKEETDNSQSFISGALEFAVDPGGAVKDRLQDTMVKGLKGVILEHDLKPEMLGNLRVMLKTLPGKKSRRKRKDRI